MLSRTPEFLALRQGKRARNVLAFLLIAVLLVLITLNINSMWQSAKLRENSAAQIVDLNHYSINLAMAHLWLEESLSSNNRQTLQLYNDAITAAEQAHHQLQHYPGVAPYDDDIQALHRYLDEFKRLAQQRLAEPIFSGVNSAIDEQFDTVFTHAIALSDRLGENLHDAVEQQQQRQVWLRKITIVLSLMVLLLGWLGMWLVNRRIHDMEQRDEQSLTALLHSEQRFRTFFEESPIALIEENHGAVLDLLTTLTTAQRANLRGFLQQQPEFLARCARAIVILDANKAALKLYGYSGKADFLAAKNKDAQPELIEKLCLIEQGDAESSSPVSFCTPQGQTIHAMLSINILPGFKRNWGSVVVSLTDISEQHQIQQRLSESEQHLQQAQAVASIGSWTLDSRSGELQWSDEVYRIFHLDRAIQPSYHLFIESIHPDDRNRVDAAWRKHAEEQAEYHIIHRVILPDHSLRYVQEQCISIFDTEGKIVHSTGTVQDVTRLMIAEQEAHLLHGVFHASPDMIVVAHHDLSLLYANRTFRCALGIDEQHRLQGLHLSDCFNHEEQSRFYSEHLPHLLKAGTWQGEGRMQHHEHGIIQVSCILQTHHHDDGHLSHISMIARDITAEKEHQEKLEHTQRLERLGVLAGGIAHDFNNILTAIMGHAAMAQERSSDTRALLEHLENIVQSSHHAADLCRQMLAYSGKGQFVIEPLNLSTTVENMGRLLAVSINKQITIHYALDHGIPPVIADTAQIQQVVMNLVINASEAIGDQRGDIHVRTHCAFYSGHKLQSRYVSDELPAGDYVVLEVRDNGCGMTADVQSRLFEPFFTTKFTGRGLGMSAILGIIRAHHGTIQLHSEAGDGTLFRVFLPAQQGATNTPLPAPSPAASRQVSRGCILLVDDEETIRRVACLVIQNMGLHVMEAVDGIDALEQFTAAPDAIDAVLLDMTMPRMGGEETLLAMRKIRPDIPIILSSGYHDQRVIEQQIDAQITRFMHKPYPPHVLQTVIHEILGREEQA